MNCSKSEIYQAGVSQEVLNKIVSNIGIKEDALPVRCLGFPWWEVSAFHWWIKILKEFEARPLDISHFLVHCN